MCFRLERRTAANHGEPRRTVFLGGFGHDSGWFFRFFGPRFPSHFFFLGWLMSEKYHFETINRLQSQCEPEYFSTFISDSFWHTSLDNKHKHFKRVAEPRSSSSSATYNHIWCPFKCFLSPGQRPKARGLRKISTSGMGKFFQKVYFSEKNLKMFQISKNNLPK